MKPIFFVKPNLIAKLAVDAARAEEGNYSFERELADAPVLDAWSVGRPTALGLQGTVTGHPLLRDGQIFTSATCIMARDYSWVRTLSRFYRLARRSDMQL